METFVDLCYQEAVITKQLRDACPSRLVGINKHLKIWLLIDSFFPLTPLGIFYIFCILFLFYVLLIYIFSVYMLLDVLVCVQGKLFS